MLPSIRQAALLVAKGRCGYGATRIFFSWGCVIFIERPRIVQQIVTARRNISARTIFLIHPDGPHIDGRNITGRRRAYKHSPAMEVTNVGDLAVMLRLAPGACFSRASRLRSIR